MLRLAAYKTPSAARHKNTGFPLAVAKLLATSLLDFQSPGTAAKENRIHGSALNPKQEMPALEQK